jgi:5-methylcytosine-specific restriction endonuclease McrA
MEKSKLLFSKNKSMTDGLQNVCKECFRQYRDKSYTKKYNDKYRAENRDKLLKEKREYYKNNRGIKNASESRRRASKIQATPSWLSKFDLDYMKHLFIQSQELSRLTKIEHQVDHIVPLRSYKVCGLHVPWNLQIITAEENLSKGNRI